MSRQLSIASAFSILALSALALFAPRPDAYSPNDAGAAIEIATPAMVSILPLID